MIQPVQELENRQCRPLPDKVAMHSIIVLKKLLLLLLMLIHDTYGMLKGTTDKKKYHKNGKNNMARFDHNNMHTNTLCRNYLQKLI